MNTHDESQAALAKGDISAQATKGEGRDAVVVRRADEGIEGQRNEEADAPGVEVCDGEVRGAGGVGREQEQAKGDAELEGGKEEGAGGGEEAQLDFDLGMGPLRGGMGVRRKGGRK